MYPRMKWNLRRINNFLSRHTHHATPVSLHPNPEDTRLDASVTVVRKEAVLILIEEILRSENILAEDQKLFDWNKD